MNKSIKFLFSLSLILTANNQLVSQEVGTIVQKAPNVSISFQNLGLSADNCLNKASVFSKNLFNHSKNCLTTLYKYKYPIISVGALYGIYKYLKKNRESKKKLISDINKIFKNDPDLDNIAKKASVATFNISAWRNEQDRINVFPNANLIYLYSGLINDENKENSAFFNNENTLANSEFINFLNQDISNGSFLIKSDPLHKNIEYTKVTILGLENIKLMMITEMNKLDDFKQKIISALNIPNLDSQLISIINDLNKRYNVNYFRFEPEQVHNFKSEDLIQLEKAINPSPGLGVQSSEPDLQGNASSDKPRNPDVDRKHVADLKKKSEKGSTSSSVLKSTNYKISKLRELYLFNTHQLMGIKNTFFATFKVNYNVDPNSYNPFKNGMFKLYQYSIFKKLIDSHYSDYNTLIELYFKVVTAYVRLDAMANVIEKYIFYKVNNSPQLEKGQMQKKDESPEYIKNCFSMCIKQIKDEDWISQEFSLERIKINVNMLLNNLESFIVKVKVKNFADRIAKTRDYVNNLTLIQVASARESFINKLLYQVTFLQGLFNILIGHHKSQANVSGQLEAYLNNNRPPFLFRNNE